MGKGLTVKQVAHMKAPQGRRVEVPAGPPGGLYLVVHPTGRKGWAFRYRYRGRARNLTFTGAYPDMGLAAARAEAEAALSSLAQDVDPAVAQDDEKMGTEPQSSKAVADEWIARYVRPNTKTWSEVQRILNREVLPVWPDRYISEIERPDVLRLLDSIVDRGAPVLANRVLSILKQFFRWSVERGYLEMSPIAELRPPTIEKSRDRVLTAEEIAEVWNAAPDLGFPLGPWFRFMMLTAQRRGEVTRMEWSHVDLDAALWSLPRESTKAGRSHDVPLAPEAVELLRGMPRFEGRYVFTTTSGDRPLQGFSRAKAAIDAKIKERRRERWFKDDIAHWVVHDLRRTVATWMAQNSVPPHVLAAILNHTPGSTQGVTSIYNRFRYSEERREALEAWAEFVQSLEVSGGEKEEKTA